MSVAPDASRRRSAVTADELCAREALHRHLMPKLFLQVTGGAAQADVHAAWCAAARANAPTEAVRSHGLEIAGEVVDAALDLERLPVLDDGLAV